MAAKTKISFSLDDSDLAYFRAILRAAKKNAAEVERSVIEDGVLLGGIGVSGANQEADEDCARAAVAALGQKAAEAAD